MESETAAPTREELALRRTETIDAATSHTRFTGDGAARHGIDEALVVLLGLVGVPAGECAEGAVHLVGSTQVAGDHRGAAGTRVALCQQLVADPPVVGESAVV